MLVPTFRRVVPCNLRRLAGCIAYRNRTKEVARIAQHRSDNTGLLPVTVPNVAACRIYSTESESEARISLPMLMDGPSQITPSLFVPVKLLYLMLFKIPHIDKDFTISEFTKGALYATSVISKALTDKNYESLSDLVTVDTIETLRAKIETLSPNQRQLITVNRDSIQFYIINDIDVATDDNSDEHAIKISTVCHYMPNFHGKQHKVMGVGFPEMSKDMIYVICNYTFMRKYVNNIGGPWIVTFVNHYSLT